MIYWPLIPTDDQRVADDLEHANLPVARNFDLGGMCTKELNLGILINWINYAGRKETALPHITTNEWNHQPPCLRFPLELKEIFLQTL